MGALLPPGLVYSAGTAAGSTFWLIGPVIVVGTTCLIARHALRHCDRDLRRWYDLNQGRKVMS
jgi:hypothetical protein